MKLNLTSKPVLDERELQEMYHVEHRGLWMMYTLLCAAVAVQLILGAPVAQIAGELTVIGVVSLWLFAAYARRGIWDEHARPSTKDNAVYAALVSIGLAVIVLIWRHDAGLALAMGAAMFVICFALLTALMAFVRRSQSRQSDALEEELDEDESRRPE